MPKPYILKLRCLLCFMLFSCSFFAQETYLEGKILADSIAYREVNIINLTKKIGTINQKDGSFKITAKLGDTLFFSSIQYEVKRLPVTKEVLQSQPVMVSLTTEINELTEVVITDIQLTGDAKKDAALIPTKPYFNPFGGGENKYTVEERRLYTAVTSSSGIPLDLLINSLTGRLKRLKRDRDNAYFEKLIQESKDLMRLNFFTDDLHIEADYVDDFIYFTSDDKRFKPYVKQKRTLELITLFKSKVKPYELFKAAQNKPLITE